MGDINLSEKFVLLLHPAQDLFAGLPPVSIDVQPAVLAERRQ